MVRPEVVYDYQFPISVSVSERSADLEMLAHLKNLMALKHVQGLQQEIVTKNQGVGIAMSGFQPPKLTSLRQIVSRIFRWFPPPGGNTAQWWENIVTPIEKVHPLSEGSQNQALAMATQKVLVQMMPTLVQQVIEEMNA